MPDLTEKQIHDMADNIASLVALTPTDQRAQLYEMVGLKLRQRCQNFSARLFEAISRADMKGG